jgi:hypothetical protein
MPTASIKPPEPRRHKVSNIARRSTFENANMTIIFQSRGLISEEEKEGLLTDLDSECRMISALHKELRDDILKEAVHAA